MKYDYLSLNTTVRSEPYYIESTIETPTEIYQKKVPLNITGTATIIDNNSFKLDIDIGSLNATNFSVSGYGWHLGYEDYVTFTRIEETPFVYNNGSGIYTFSDCDFYHGNRFELYANIPVIGKKKIAICFSIALPAIAFINGNKISPACQRLQYRLIQLLLNPLLHHQPLQLKYLVMLAKFI